MKTYKHKTQRTRNCAMYVFHNNINKKINYAIEELIKLLH